MDITWISTGYCILVIHWTVETGCPLGVHYMSIKESTFNGHNMDIHWILFFGIPLDAGNCLSTGYTLLVLGHPDF